MSDEHRSRPQQWLRELPALPQVVVNLQAALARDDVSLDYVADTVSHDQALAAKALRIANCSFYGVPSRVVSIRQAIGILGLRSVSTLLVAAAVSDRFPRIVCEGFDLRRYWRHSVAVALCARQIARHSRIEPDTAFTAGLLHDLGRLAIASQSARDLERAYKYRTETDCQMLEAERRELATDHAEIGADVSQRWNFGAEVIDVLRRHHQPPASTSVTVIDVVHVADNVAHALDLAHDPAEMVPPLDSAAWNRVGLTQAQCLAVFENTEAELDGLCEALAV
jgi:putative nucleotidyltransferase with HDIG domain